MKDTNNTIKWTDRSLTQPPMNTETQNKHTPGPWTIRSESMSFASVDIITDTRPGLTLARVLMDLPQSDANANLIRSAPELAEALKAFCIEFESIAKAEGWSAAEYSSNHALLKARAALAKAGLGGMGK